ncbi:hypothetical protein HELRODRAFT_99505 [Helobdella robusta]|uniref:Protein krueppel n=1 Tax=Helobdella robusta TaxID=6412 RepID=T1G9T1_HELRO|nr:hypothetical protein HELRODRAFT_99505 [Helobdella robusta]ESO04608.1 hypothetical protein HELRODRAFT_99505 [Helobdella robusta]
MSIKCCAAGCRSNSDHQGQTFTFFQFPDEKAKCDVWLESIGREDLKYLSAADLFAQYYVCSHHFDEAYVQAAYSDDAAYGNGEDTKVMQIEEPMTSDQAIDSTIDENIVMEDGIDVLNGCKNRQLVFVEGVGPVFVKGEKDNLESPPPRLGTTALERSSYIYHSSFASSKNHSSQKFTTAVTSSTSTATRSQIYNPKVQKVVNNDGKLLIYVCEDSESSDVSAAASNIMANGVEAGSSVGLTAGNLIYMKPGTNDLLQAGLGSDPGKQTKASASTLNNSSSSSIKKHHLTKRNGLATGTAQSTFLLVTKTSPVSAAAAVSAVTATATVDNAFKMEKEDEMEYLNAAAEHSDILVNGIDHNDDDEGDDLSNCKTFLCHTCGQDFTDINQLSKHMYCHNNLALTPDDAYDEYDGEAAVVDDDDGNDNSNNDATGGDDDDSAGVYNNVIREEDDSLIFKCASCGMAFNMFDQLRIHVRSHVQSRNYSCDVCGATFSHRSNLSRHKLQHCAAKKFQCDQCGKGFTQKSNLMSHQSMVHYNTGSDSVALSTLSFSGRSGAERIHRKPKTHSCDICGKSFVSLTGLKNHGALHTGNRPFKCAICEKAFTLMSCLKTHMGTIHTDKKIYCELCGKTYQSEHYLKVHLRIHTGTKDFECEMCSKRFIDMPSLKLHTRTHTGEKPFVCKMCARSFTQQSHLKTHMRIHTGEKPYDCKDCGKKFRQLSNVLEHARTHRK